MAIDAALKIVDNGETRDLKRFTQPRSVRQENIRKEHTVTSTYLKSKTMRPNCQTSGTLKIMRLRYPG